MIKKPRYRIWINAFRDKTPEGVVRPARKRMLKRNPKQ